MYGFRHWSTRLTAISTPSTPMTLLWWLYWAQNRWKNRLLILLTYSCKLILSFFIHDFFQLYLHYSLLHVLLVMILFNLVDLLCFKETADDYNHKHILIKKAIKLGHWQLLLSETGIHNERDFTCDFVLESYVFHLFCEVKTILSKFCKNLFNFI